MADIDWSIFDRASMYLCQRYKPEKQNPAQIRAAIKMIQTVPFEEIRATGKHETVRLLMSKTDIDPGSYYREYGSEYATLILYRYLLEILRSDENVSECCSISMDTFLEKAGNMRKEFRDFYEQKPENKKCKVYTLLVELLVAAGDEFTDLYYAKRGIDYRQIQATKNLSVIREELMQKTWHPSRVEWWMDEEEYTEMFGKK